MKYRRNLVKIRSCTFYIDHIVILKLKTPLQEHSIISSSKVDGNTNCAIEL